MRDELPLRLMIAAYVAFLLVLIVIAIALARISTPGESGYLPGAAGPGNSSPPQPRPLPDPA